MSFTDKQIDRLPNDTIKKLQRTIYRAADLIETFFPDPNDSSRKVKLDPAQKDFVDIIQFGYPLSQFKVGEIKRKIKGVIYICRRQVGKSWGCGSAAAALMITGPGYMGVPPTRIGMIAANEEEAELLIEKTKYCLENSDFNEFIDGKVKVDKIKLINGSFSKSHTCSQKSIRGPSYHYNMIDESALMDESVLFGSAMPTVTHGERWIAITTPQGGKGKLIELYIKSVASRPVICNKCGRNYDQKDFPLASFPTKNYIWEMPKLPPCSCGGEKYKYGIGLFATPYLDPWHCSLIDPVQLKLELDSFSWSPWVRQELLGEIVDEASMVILNDWIVKNTNDKLRNVLNYNPSFDYVMGVDYGRLHDASAMTVVHKDETSGRIIFDYMKTVSGEYDYQTDYDGIHNTLGGIVKYFNPRTIVMDSTGLGYSQVERVKKDLQLEWRVGSKIYCNTKDKLGFVISKQSKVELIGNFIAMISKNPPALEIPPRTEPEFDELVLEMLNYQCEVGEQGYIKYGTQQYHDDRLISAALAIYPFKQNKSFSAKPMGAEYRIFPRQNEKFKTKYVKVQPNLLTVF
jgi:hypothetical protein